MTDFNGWKSHKTNAELSTQNKLFHKKAKEFSK